MPFSTVQVCSLEITRLDVGISHNHWPVTVQGSFQCKLAEGSFNSVRCNAKRGLYYCTSNRKIPFTLIYYKQVGQANEPALREWKRQRSWDRVKVQTQDLIKFTCMTQVGNWEALVQQWSNGQQLITCPTAPRWGTVMPGLRISLVLYETCLPSQVQVQLLAPAGEKSDWVTG